jgi:predicted outer membrane repeat protein
VLRLAAICIALALGAGVAAASVITVDWSGGADFVHIGDAIGAASEGDTVLVAPGTYSGPANREMDFLGRRLIVTSECGSDSTTIDCEGVGRAFRLVNGEGPFAAIEGFTIRNGSAVRDTVNIFDGFGGAAMCYGASVRFQDIRFVGNFAERDGGAICAWEPGPVILMDCVFDSNAAFRGAGVSSEYVTVSTQRCVFRGNHADNWGGGIFIRAGGHLVDCTFTGNTAEFGAGVLFHRGSRTLTRCVFENNSVSQWGGAVNSLYATVNFADCCFRGNWAQYGGSAIGYSRGSGWVEGCTFIGNAGDHDSGAISCYETSPDISGCTFNGNSTPGGGAIRCQTASTPVITNSIIANTLEGPAVYCSAASCSAEVSYSCIWANAGGDSLCGSEHDNIFVDPQFCDPVACAGYLEDCSPCIGTGSGGETMGAWGVGCPCGDPTGLHESQDELILLGSGPSPGPGPFTVRYRRFGGTVPVTLRVFTPAGREVAAVRSLSHARGSECVTWSGRASDGSAVASGIYFYMLSDGPNSTRGSFVVLR